MSLDLATSLLSGNAQAPPGPPGAVAADPSPSGLAALFPALLRQSVQAAPAGDFKGGSTVIQPPLPVVTTAARPARGSKEGAVQTPSTDATVPATLIPVLFTPPAPILLNSPPIAGQTREVMDTAPQTAASSQKLPAVSVPSGELLLPAPKPEDSVTLTANLPLPAATPAPGTDTPALSSTGHTASNPSGTALLPENSPVAIPTAQTLSKAVPVPPTPPATTPVRATKDAAVPAVSPRGAAGQSNTPRLLQNAPVPADNAGKDAGLKTPKADSVSAVTANQDLQDMTGILPAGHVIALSSAEDGQTRRGNERHQDTSPAGEPQTGTATRMEAGNVAAPPSMSAAERAGMMRQIADTVSPMRLSLPAGGHGQVTLSLHPQEWGQLHVSITMAPAQPTAGEASRRIVTAHIVADNPAVKAALENQTVELRHSLREVGMQLEKLTVTVQNAGMGSQAGTAGGNGQDLNRHGSGWGQASMSSAATSHGGFSSQNGQSAFAAFADSRNQGRQQAPPTTYRAGAQETGERDSHEVTGFTTANTGRLDTRA